MKCVLSTIESYSIEKNGRGDIKEKRRGGLSATHIDQAEYKLKLTHTKFFNILIFKTFFLWFPVYHIDEQG